MSVTYMNTITNGILFFLKLRIIHWLLTFSHWLAIMATLQSRKRANNCWQVNTYQHINLINERLENYGFLPLPPFPQTSIFSTGTDKADQCHARKLPKFWALRRHTHFAFIPEDAQISHGKSLLHLTVPKFQHWDHTTYIHFLQMITGKLFTYLKKQLAVGCTTESPVCQI